MTFGLRGQPLISLKSIAVPMICCSSCSVQKSLVCTKVVLSADWRRTDGNINLNALFSLKIGAAGNYNFSAKPSVPAKRIRHKHTPVDVAPSTTTHYPTVDAANEQCLIET